VHSGGRYVNDAARSEVVVIGAGITGLSVALHLAEAGLKPLVVEREGVAAGASASSRVGCGNSGARR